MQKPQNTAWKRFYFLKCALKIRQTIPVVFIFIFKYSSKGTGAPICLSSPPLTAVMQAIMGRWGRIAGWGIGRDIVLMGGWVGTIAVALTFSCLFFSTEQEVRKVAIWWVFIRQRLPEWLNVSWRWSCRQLRGRAGPDAWGLIPGYSSSPLKEGQQSNESHSPTNLQLVLCQLYCISAAVLSV